MEELYRTMEREATQKGDLTFTFLDSAVWKMPDESLAPLRRSVSFRRACGVKYFRWLRASEADVLFRMEKKPKQSAKTPPPSPEEVRELEAKKKLARPMKDKTEVTIGPTDRSGPDVIIT